MSTSAIEPDRDLHADPLRVRTIFLSDLHLGTRGCKAEFLLDFLRSTRCERLYLVGDILDGWRLRSSPFWNHAQSEVVQLLLKKARRGTRVLYLPGNHDEALRDYVGLDFGGISVRTECVHETADGRRLLVLHGDQFDGVVQCHRWLALVGDRAYTFTLALNHWFNIARRRLGRPYWSLSAFLKHKVKNAVDFIFRFEGSVAEAARERGLDGVVCGHIHKAELRTIEGVLYANCGDWVESCTALVEHADGRLEVLDWPSLRGHWLATGRLAFDEQESAQRGAYPSPRAAATLAEARRSVAAAGLELEREFGAKLRGEPSARTETASDPGPYPGPGQGRRPPERRADPRRPQPSAR